jgi:plasmid stability protein
MATLTIRSLPEELVERIKLVAGKAGRSMEQEVRQLLEQRYASREEVLRRIEERWSRLPKASAAEIETWIAEGRE